MDHLAAWNEALRLRAPIMTEALDLAAMSGLEIGPLSHPIVRRDQGDITYVDYTEAETLRRIYDGDAHVDAGNIVEIDAVWGDRTLTECLGGRKVDYVIASHVAEHVPDLITWLAEIRAVLRPGGHLRLALPDKRFSHDALRSETRLSDLLTAWILRARRPQVRDVLDFRLHTASGVDGLGVFEGRSDLRHVKPDHSFDVAIQAATWARDRPEHYFDVHCLVVHAASFARLMHELARTGLLRLSCVRMIDTAPPLFEFYVCMTPCDDLAEVERSWRDVQTELHDPLPGSAAAALADEAQNTRAKLERSEAERLRLDACLAETARTLRALQSSWSWRVTAPLRRLRSMW